MHAAIQPPDGYRGRFAPSPTGALHFGSLVAALASYLDARSRNGTWLLRIEDIDQARCIPGAADEIIRMLADFALEWDEPIVYQSHATSQQRYRQALERLTEQGLTYPCGCSRKEIADSSQTGIEGPIYPGTCRAGLPPGKLPRAVRLRVADGDFGCEDRVQGWVSQNLAQQIGDFVLKRADGVYSYQLAVVVDDAWQGITDIVRGIDLLASTPRQLYLQRCLGAARPRYLHLPLAVNQYGLKLSKQNLALPLRRDNASAALVRALQFLGQPLPDTAAHLPPCRELLHWASAHWQADNIPRTTSIVAETVASVPKNMIDSAGKLT